MTHPDEPLLDLAAPYALNALSDAERVEIDTRLAQTADAGAFYAEVRDIRETMAAMSGTTATVPPAALRNRVLASARRDGQRGQNRWSTAVFAAAAAVAIGLGAVGVGIALRPDPASTEQQIFAAPDVRTVSGTLPTGGTATLVFSRDRHAGVLVMNNVPPPSQGTVYQMWLLDGGGAPTSAGTMDAESVAPSTTAVLPELGDATALAFTVEPGAGSPQPTGEVFARLSLV
jgi:anti-sigma-K factor RskA